MAAQHVKIRILIVDDLRDAADSLALLFRMWGHEVRTAYSGPQALQAAVGFSPHVVLLDIQMPGMHGGEVARRLRQLPHPPLLVAVSATPADDDRLAPFAELFAAHIRKPYDLMDMKQLVNSLGT